MVRHDGDARIGRSPPVLVTPNEDLTVTFSRKASAMTLYICPHSLGESLPDSFARPITFAHAASACPPTALAVRV